MTVVQVEEEVVLRFWEFPMSYGKTWNTTGWEDPQECFMAIADVGEHQVIGFYWEAADLRSDFPLDKEGIPDFENAELEMRFSLFQRMVGRLETQDEIGEDGVGRFERLGRKYVQFTTVCGAEYRLEYADLLKLAWD